LFSHKERKTKEEEERKKKKDMSDTLLSRKEKIR
jgi:hypothetical protein